MRKLLTAADMAVAPAYAAGMDYRRKKGRSTMDDTLMSEEYEEEEGDSGTSGILTLDGEAWKNRDNTTYNSVLAEQMFMYQANI